MQPEVPRIKVNIFVSSLNVYEPNIEVMWVLGFGEYPNLSPILEVSIKVEDDIISLWLSMLVVNEVMEKRVILDNI